MRSEHKRRDEQEKERYREQVRQQMEIQEQERKNMIMNQIHTTDERVGEVKHQHEREMMLKKEMENLKRKDRLEQAERVKRQQEYERDLMAQKIKADDFKTQKLQNEKSSLMDMRREIKIKAEREKQKMMENFLGSAKKPSKTNRNKTSQSLLRPNSKLGSNKGGSPGKKRNRAESKERLN